VKGWVDELPPEQEPERWQRLRSRGHSPIKTSPKPRSVARGAGRGGRSQRLDRKLEALLGKVDE
jgi:hypothetical protein